MRPSIEARILATYLGDAACEAYTISELARQTKAAYPHAHAAVTALIGKGVLHATTVGKAIYCFPDYANERCRLLACEANLCWKERLLAAPNMRNLDVEISRLLLAEPRIIAVLHTPSSLRFLVTEKSAQRAILRQTALANCSFSTAGEFRSELLLSLTPLRGATVLAGYDRLMLLLSPIQEQLRLRHARLFRGDDFCLTGVCH